MFKWIEKLLLKWRPYNSSENFTVSNSSPLSDFDNSAIENLTCATPKSFSNSASASVPLPLWTKSEKTVSINDDR